MSLIQLCDMKECFPKYKTAGINEKLGMDYWEMGMFRHLSNHFMSGIPFDEFPIHCGATPSLRC